MSRFHKYDAAKAQLQTEVSMFLEGRVRFVRYHTRRCCERNVSFGLTVYESTEHVDVTYEWDHGVPYVRASQAPAKRRPADADAATPYKQHMPSGYLPVRAYSPQGA